MSHSEEFFVPYELLGGHDVARAIARRFYEHMAEDEPELARLHELDESGAISAGTQERFSLFLIEWLGGPKLFSPVYGHPRLRMRHASVLVNLEMRDAWLRCMQSALDDLEVTGDIRSFLDQRFAEVANFLRNTSD